MKYIRNNKHGQVWIETVLYTLIGLSLLGLVLAFVGPKLSESKERLLVEQTISSLSLFDEKIIAVGQGPGNVRRVDFLMKEGILNIDGNQNSIIFVLPEMNSMYSEPGAEIEFGGRMKILTEKEGKKYKVTLKLAYTNNITYKLSDEPKTFNAASTPHLFSIENMGDISGKGDFVISIDELS